VNFGGIFRSGLIEGWVQNLSALRREASSRGDPSPDRAGGGAHAQNLIKGRQYEKDSDWSEAQPFAEEENRFIGENGWEAFAKWHLAYDTEASEETKSRYKFPFGDFRRLHRSALIAAKQRASSEDYDEVQRAAGRLLEMLPGEDDR
jgi:hypothetical protein